MKDITSEPSWTPPPQVSLFDTEGSALLPVISHNSGVHRGPTKKVDRGHAQGGGVAGEPHGPKTPKKAPGEPPQKKAFLGDQVPIRQSPDK